ncbi:MAG TPA: FAD-dependent oxidoreductase [Streptosporangiaceae bacterium]
MTTYVRLSARDLDVTLSDGSGRARRGRRAAGDLECARPRVGIRYHSEVRKLDGTDRLECVTVEDLTTSALDTIPANALFVMIGAEPRSRSLGKAVQLDRNRYILTGPELGPDARRQQPWTTLDRDPYMLETSMPGVFAAGDVRSGSVKRVASAVGERSIAIRFVNLHLGQRRAGLVPPQTVAVS